MTSDSLRERSSSHNSIEKVREQEQEHDQEEKHVGVTTTTSFDSSNMDEAMRLVGAERTAVFSEEYNAKLRRKLVSVEFL
jgi:histone acetyltransferase (RNA polymerase elongator complex component)